MAKLPAAYWNEPPAEFVELYRERRDQGIERLRKSRVAFVGNLGLARLRPRSAGIAHPRISGDQNCRMGRSSGTSVNAIRARSLVRYRDG